jgi:hypothetical protein
MRDQLDPCNTAMPKLKGALFIEPGRIVPDEKPIPAWDHLIP